MLHVKLTAQVLAPDAIVHVAPDEDIVPVGGGPASAQALPFQDVGARQSFIFSSVISTEPVIGSVQVKK
jgi:hypothetical protein